MTGTTVTYSGKDTAELLEQAIEDARERVVIAMAMCPNDPVWNGTLRDLQNEVYRLTDISDGVKANGAFLRNQQ